jgi:regulatory protein
MQKSIIRLSLMDYALYLLGRRRYTVAEMQKKLSARVNKINRLNKSESENNPTETSENIPAVIAKLQELKLLNDGEFAQLYIQDQLLRKPQGIRLLKRNMAQKGLGKEIIQKAVSETSDDLSAAELALAVRAANKKLKTLTKNLPQKRREKLARFLFARGFSASVAYRVVNSKLGEIAE